MKAQTPPIDWAWAMMWLTRVVLPEDSGPKISTIRPRGTPPMPSAKSSASAPVGIESTLTVPLSPRRIREPCPKSRSICVTAASSAASLALASLADASLRFAFAISDHLTAALPGQLDLCQRHVLGTGWLEFRTVERHPAANPCLREPLRQPPRRLRNHRRAPRSPRLGPNPSHGHMRPE